MSDAALAHLVTGAVTITTMIVGFLTLWVKLRYGVEKAEEAASNAKIVERKVDDNTRITIDGAQAATVNAQVAAVAASEAKATVENVVDTIGKKLDGGLDMSIEAAVKPIRDALTDYALRYESDMKEIHSALDDLRKRIR